MNVIDARKWSEKIRKIYIKASILILNTVIIFVILNCISWCGLKVWDKSDVKVKRGNTESPKKINDLCTVYPGNDPGTISALLQETWSRPYVYEPYTLFKERPFQGKFVKVSEHGFRETGFAKKWPPDSSMFNIFVFGGSTMFGYGVLDEQTVSAYLEEKLRRRYPSIPIMIYNFGRGFYYSSQESVLFLRLLSNGFRPNVSIFVDGLNDFNSYSVNNDEPNGSENIKELIDGEYYVKYKKTIIFDLLSEYLPAYRAMKEAIQPIIKSDDPEFAANVSMLSNEKEYDNEILLGKVINKYFKNKQLIEAMGNRFDVKTIFVWQPVPTYKYDLKYHLFTENLIKMHGYSKYGYPRMEQYVKSHPQGNNFIWAANIQEGVREPLYVDIVHYSDKMSEMLADHIGNEIAQRRLFNVGSAK